MTNFYIGFLLLPKILNGPYDHISLYRHIIMKAVISFLALSLSSLVLAQNPYLDAYQAVLARRWAEEATAQKAISLANDIESEEDKDELASPSHEESDDSRSQQDGLESSDGGKISDDDVKAILRYYATGKLLSQLTQNSIEYVMS